MSEHKTLSPILKPPQYKRNEMGQFERPGATLAKTAKKAKPVNKRNATGIGGFQPGQSGNPAGRPKGAKNKTTLQLREAILSALDKLGGDDYLVALGRENSSAFASLLAKVYPTTLAASDSNGGAGVKVEFRRILVWPGGREEEVDGVTPPKALPPPDAHALPRPTDPTDDTNEGAV